MLHLTKIGVSSDNCMRVLSSLFDHDGVVGSADELTSDKRMAELLKYVRQANIDAVEYLQCRVIPKISSNCALMYKEAWLGSFAWTNNNCESANHLLKMGLNWQPTRITDLVDHLHDLACMQYNELRYAMSGQGDFQLAQPFAKHYVPRTQWLNASQERKDRLFKAFLLDSNVRVVQKTVSSTDGLLTVTGSPKIARKPNQHTRPKATRTACKNV